MYRHLYAIAAILAVLTAASIGTTHAKRIAANNPLQVFVTNSTTSAVPVAPQGTTTVSGTVNLANGAAVAISNEPTVNLSNDANNPVPVRDVDVASRTPITLHNAITMDDGTPNAAGDDMYVVPAGKRLVVQNVFVSTFEFPVGEQLTQAGILQEGGLTFSIPTQDQGEDTENNEHVNGYFTGAIYFSAGAVLTDYASRSSKTGSADIGVMISGYLENAP